MKYALTTPAPAWYVGAPGAGKTTAAVAHALKWQRESGAGLLVVDTLGAANFGRLPLVAPGARLAELWRSPKWRAKVQPNDAREFAQVLTQARAGGNLALVIDEAALWFQQGGTGSLLALLRAYRHSRAAVYLTTQHLSGDVPQAALALAPVVYAFRTTAPRSLDRLAQMFGEQARGAQNMERGRYLRLSLAFEPTDPLTRAKTNRTTEPRKRARGARATKEPEGFEG